MNKDKIGFFAVFASIIIFIFTVYVGFDLYSNLKIRGEVLGKKQKILADVSYWENITQKYKGYRDGHFTLALLYFRLNNLEKARENLNIVFILDPNFKKGRELEQFLIQKF